MRAAMVACVLFALPLAALAARVSPAAAAGVASVSVVADPSNPVANQQVALTVTIDNPAVDDATGDPIGTVELKSGPLGAEFDTFASTADIAWIDGSTTQARATVSWPFAVSTWVKARYLAPGQVFGTDSPSIPINVQAAPTVHQTAIELTTSTVVAGQQATFTARVTTTDGSPEVPEGTVHFYDRDAADPSAEPVLMGDGTLSGGVATLTKGGFTGGSTHEFIAKFQGDTSRWTPSTSPPVVVTVATPPSSWSIALEATPGSVVGSDSIQLAARVTSSSGTAASGTVLFLGGPAPRTADLVGGVASISVGGWPLGRHEVTARYTPAGGTTISASTTVSFRTHVVVQPSASAVYGGPAQVSLAYSGLATTDPAPEVAPTCTAATGLGAGSHPGAVTCSGASDPRYEFEYRPGTLSVTRAPLTVRADDATAISGSLPQLHASFAGFVDGDGPASLGGSLSCSTTATAASPPGHYAISCGGLTSADYAISFVDGTLTLTPWQLLHVTAPDVSLVYGDPIPASFAPALSPAGAVLDAAPTCTTTADSGAVPGAYPIVCSGGSAPGYTLEYAPGTLTVAPATLTVTPDDVVVSGTAPVPAPTATVTGFVAGEDAASAGLTGAPACSTEATDDSPAGSYAIVCTAGTLHAPNYVFAVAGPGTVTIEPVATTVDGLVHGPVLADGTIELTGRLRAGATPLPGRALTLTLGGASCTAVTDAAGAARCTVSPAGLGPATTTASFARAGRYQPTTASGLAVLYAFAPGGAFVVGDRSATGSVAFWGAQWSKRNALSAGSAPAAFAGFARTPGSLAPGSRWTSGPGNSTPPPKAELPSYMGVIVTSSASKSGATISGTVVGIAVVRVDGGYAPNPGHAGTGTVVATG